MADYTALVEAGNALVELLRENLTPEPIGKREFISLCAPYESESNQLTVYLFHLEEEGLSSMQGYQPASRDMERMRPTSLQASFLITAHSKAPAQMREADQYRMIGGVIQTVKDMPILDSRYLNGSLARTQDRLVLSLERPNMDQMMKIWNSTSVPYRLSVVVKVSGITIDSTRTRRIHRVTEVEIGTGQRREQP